MDNREFYSKLIERYINVARKSSLEEFYGKGSEVKITNLIFPAFGFSHNIRVPDRDYLFQ